MSAELTPREHDVMRAVIAGSSGRAIGEQLGISHRTVEIHRSNAIAKLGAANAVQAAILYDRQQRAGEPA